MKLIDLIKKTCQSQAIKIVEFKGRKRGYETICLSYTKELLENEMIFQFLLNKEIDFIETFIRSENGNKFVELEVILKKEKGVI